MAVATRCNPAPIEAPLRYGASIWMLTGLMAGAGPMGGCGRAADAGAFRRGGAAAQDTASEALGTLSGRVTRRESGEGIEGAVLALWPVAEGGARASADILGGAPLLAITDAAGSWTLGGVEPGHYRLAAAAPGYLPGSSAEVELAPGGAQRAQELRLGAGGSPLEGMVRTVEGTRVDGAWVRAEPWGPEATDMMPVQVVASPTGYFSMQLPPGRYRLEAWRSGVGSAHAEVEVRDDAAPVDLVLRRRAAL